MANSNYLWNSKDPVFEESRPLHYSLVDRPVHYLPMTTTDLLELFNSKRSLPRYQPLSSKHDHADNISSVHISWTIETPSIILFDRGEQTTGALFSGVLFVHVENNAAEFRRLMVLLSVRLSRCCPPRYPVSHRWTECQTQSISVKKWDILGAPTMLQPGLHRFPFFHFIPGSVPATVDTPSFSISYDVEAAGTVAPAANDKSMTKELELKNSIIINRYFPSPKPLCRFHAELPPLNARVTALYDGVVEPRGEKQVTIHLSNLQSYNQTFRELESWRLKKVSWRFEETIQSRFPPCKHSPPAKNATNDIDIDVRVLSKGALHKGWETGDSSRKDAVDLTFSYFIDRKISIYEWNYACDVQYFHGVEVKHSLNVEMLFAQETATEGHPNLATPSGTGHVHRLSLDVVLTGNHGKHISWEEEAPPPYLGPAS
ncbi:hypothetical protein B0T10DRAFT_464623 [Thelonectria olida]|uniref:LDB19 N-terminal domain-containing protein n=1 Tax=Thelonectria olida TaxID=1576542 RepID=A0A9P9AKJ2_9HYPO|nr:hypothetical protein B0T10DRAFT_464623 [Thelonectria olida]